MRYTYRLEQHQGKYWGSVIDLDVCIGCGRTLKALEADLAASIELWVESSVAHGDDVPISRSLGEHTVEITKRTALLIAAARATSV